MNIVVVDGAELAPNVDFPPLEAEKYGWSQHPRLHYGEIAPTYWRSKVVISYSTALDAACMDELKLIQLLVTGAEFTTTSEGSIRNGIR